MSSRIEFSMAENIKCKINCLLIRYQNESTKIFQIFSIRLSLERVPNLFLLQYYIEKYCTFFHKLAAVSYISSAAQPASSIHCGIFKLNKFEYYWSIRGVMRKNM